MQSFFIFCAALVAILSPTQAYGQGFWGPFSNLASIQEEQPDVLNPKWDAAEWQPYHESLVSVHTNKGARGSGVIVGLVPELQEFTVKGVTANYRLGYVMTCAHVTFAGTDPNNYLLKFTNGAKVTGDLIYMDQGRDVAIIECLVPEQYSAVRVAEVYPEDGDALVGVGLGGSTPVITDRDSIRRFKVTCSEMTGRDWIRADECLIPGDSGGPLFNSDGELVGLHCMGHESFSKPFQDRVVWPAIFCGTRSLRIAMDSVPSDALPK